MHFEWWQVQRIIVGISAYGLPRTISGLVELMKLRITKPKKGSITTKQDSLIVNFMYPQQFSYSLILFQDFVEPEFELLRHLLTKDAVFFDVGGAIGTYSLFVAKLVAGPVHTFEPVAENIQTLKENLRLNNVESKVQVNAVALSDQEGFGHLQRGESLYYSHLQYRVDAHGKDTYDATAYSVASATLDEVPVTTLQTYCLQHKIEHIDILKIDTEGHTPAILRGAQGLLEQHQVDLLIVEMDRGLEEIYGVLNRYGYEGFAYDATQKTLVHLLSSGEQLFVEAKRSIFHSNIVFIHQNALSKYQKSITIKL